ncbi:MAG: alpha/beta fold hydrolase [Chloroflexi bacterium]|nr:alpha/beta fold hydrolase [Chloroflexota bacterium]
MLLRTPDARFENLPGFPFAPHYIEINGARIHYVDEGQGDPILCLHGEPSWSYLYRKMIPPLAQKQRVLAMDFVGFGRSDKYADEADYSFQMHRDTLVGFIEALDLQEITLVVQDWGGLIGLTVATQLPERFARLVIMNTGLPGGEPMPDAFLQWRQFCERAGRQLPIGRILQNGTFNQLPPEVIAAYNAPFPDDSYKAGAAVWPLMVPTQPNDPGAVDIRQARKLLADWPKPVLILFSDKDPITAGGDLWFRQLMHIRKSDQPRIVIEDAGHFLQEDKGEKIAKHILAFI